MVETIIKLGHKGIVYEDYAEFDKSIFESVYREAKKYVYQIVMDNIQLEQSENYGNNFRNKEQVDNIIAFIGRRGTGKTSAMLSFMEGLKDHNKNGNKMLEQDSKNEFRFIGFEWIEASLLEKDEDIFETILIKMFGEFQKKAKDIYGRGRSYLEQKNKELCQMFETVYKRILQMKNKDAVYQTDSVLTALRDLSRGSSVREEFAELIKVYISFMNGINERERECRKTYLVVAIDDIDVNIENGYEILDQIHRYLMVPGLIVLVAINFEEMLLCCEKHYVDAYSNLVKVNWDIEFEKRSKQISEEYLEKVLPPYRRVYLPSLKKKDYFIKSKNSVKIDMDKYKSIKEGIFKLIWKRTGVYYDALGKKRHFMESSTLRNLETNYELFHGMKELPKQSDENYLQIYDENYHKVLNDILFRFALECLPEREYNLFMLWNEEEILRRGEEIVENVTSNIRYLAEKQKKYEKIVKDYEEFPYSYGQLLRSLYLMGHMWDYNEKKGRKRIYDKKLVHVLLEQYTVTLSWVYEHYLLEEANEKMRYRNILDELLSGSIVGTWGKEIGPKVGNSFNLSEDACLGEVQKIKLNDWYFNIEKNADMINRLCERWSWESCAEFMCGDDFLNIIITIFFLRNIDKSSTGENGTYSFLIKSGNKGSQEGGDSRISLNGEAADYGIFNFVNNSFHYEETLRDIYVAFAEAMFQVSKNKGNFEKSLIGDKVDEFLVQEKKKSGSLLNEFVQWDNKGGSLALPIYNMDITYNLVKRLINKYDYGIKEERIELDDVYNIIKNIFDVIKKELKRQDDFYNGCESIFAKHFEECPIVRRICQDDNNKYQNIFLYFFENDYKQKPKEAEIANLSDEDL